MFSAKLLFFLIARTFLLQCTIQGKQIRGTPEVDYPTYYVIPKTSFRCSDQLYNPGFYADTETRCQVFHYCFEHRQESFLCPMGTIFNQPILACDYWYSTNCSLAPSYYHVNAFKRNEEHFDDADNHIEYQPGNVFDKMAHLYETNDKTSESPLLKNCSDSPENELLSRDGTKSSDEQLIPKNNETEDYNKYSFDNQFNMVDEKHPEVVQYEVVGFDAVNVHKGSENEQLHETDNAKDFILSEDGTLHTSQEDAYQNYPTDMNFDQGYGSGYAEIPNEGKFNYASNEDSDSKSDYQMPDFEVQRRYSNVNGDYVRRRPSRRKSIIIPEAEPEIFQLPVAKPARKRIQIASTVSTEANSESSYETTYDSNIYNEDTMSLANEEGLEGIASGEFTMDASNLNPNDYEFSNPKLFSENQEEINDESGSQMYEVDSSSVIYDNSNKKRPRNPYVLSNTVEDEISPNIFGSRNDDILDISNFEHQSTLTDSNYSDESEIFIENSAGSTVILGDSLDTTVDEENSLDNDPFLGSYSEDNIIQPHSSHGSTFPEDQYIFSDSEDSEITDIDASDVPPMNLSDAFEGSGSSLLETAGMPNFAEEVNEPVHFILKDDSKDVIKYGGESPSESSENNDGEELVLDGSGGSMEFNYLSHELPEFSDNPEHTYKTVPEIREIDGSYYYVFSDSGYPSNFNYDDSKEIYSEVEDYPVTENFEVSSDKASEEIIDNEVSQYVPADSKSKVDNTEDNSVLTLDYENSRHLENTYERQAAGFEAETLSDILEEEYTVDDSDSDGLFSTEDLKYLEIMSQTPVPIVKDLFEVSSEKHSTDINDQESYKDPASMNEVYEFESFSTETPSDIEEHSADINNQETHEYPTSMNGVYEFESFSTETSSDIEEHSADINNQETHEDPTSMNGVYEFERFSTETPSDIGEHSADINNKETHEDPTSVNEVYEFERFSTETPSDIEEHSADINNQETHEDPASMNEVYEFERFSTETSSDIEEHLDNMEPSEILNFEQKIYDVSITDGSGQDGSVSKSKEVFVPSKEGDPFSPLFTKSDGIELDGPKPKRLVPFKPFPVKPKNVVVTPVMGKDLKKAARGKRFNENLRTFNPPQKGNPLNAPSKETFRETMFTNIPSEFLKMKHSTLRPYFYNYGLKNHRFVPRTGDQFKSSKFSKLTSLGKRLLAAKRGNFDIMKKYVNYYRND